MTFSEFAKLMHSYIGCDRQQQEYVQYLTSLVMREPLTPEEEEADNEDRYNPLSGKTKSLLGKIYSGEGKHKISKADARTIKGRFNRVKFIDEFINLEDEAQENLIAELGGYGVHATIYDVDEVCAELFNLLINALAEGKNFIETGTIPRVDSTGKIITETPLTSAYVIDGKIYIGGETIELPVQLKATEEIEIHELPYINALFEAYAEFLNRKEVTKDDIDTSSPKRYKNFFSDQRKAYYAAESIQRSVREVFGDGENQFCILKEDAFDGIKETYWRDHENGLLRLLAVLEKITSTTLSKSALTHIINLIGNLEKKGICHILVNDEMIKSWVDIDG